MAKKKRGRKSKGLPEHYLKITQSSQVEKMAKRRCISLEEAGKIWAQNRQMASNRKPPVVKNPGIGETRFSEKCTANANIATHSWAARQAMEKEARSAWQANYVRAFHASDATCLDISGDFPTPL